MPKKNNKTLEAYKFPGFTSPRYTQIPDIVFDELQHRLTGSEYKVLMYILRRTFGFKKDADSISYNQMLKGIVKRDGTRLDYGAGVKSPATLTKAIKRLEELGIILAVRNSSDEKGLETTTYQPQMGAQYPTTKNEVGGTTKNEVGLLQKSKQQETEKQETEKQQHVVALLLSKGIGRYTAQRLAKEHTEDYVRQKIAYLDYLLDVDSAKVRNPKGWLRRAIEEDYGAPDGFKTPEEREAERLEEERIEQAKREKEEKQAQVLEAEQERKKEELANWLRSIREHYKVPSDLSNIWDDLGHKFEAMDGPSFLTSYLNRSQLAAVRDGVAVIVTQDESAAKYMNAKFSWRLANELKAAGLDVESLQIIPWDNDKSQED